MIYNCFYFLSFCHSKISTLDTIFVKVSRDDAQLQLHGPHGFGVQSVSVRPAVDQVRAEELGTSADEHLRQPFLPGAHGPPGRTAYSVMSRTRRDVAETITIELAPSERILMPHL